MFFNRLRYNLLGNLIDGETVITGSFNFTKADEESSAENLLVIRDKKLAGIYTKSW